MSKYNISLGVILETDDLQRIRTQINRLETDPIRIQLDTSQVQSQINNIRTQIQQLGNIRINLGGGNGGNGGGLNNTTRGVNEVTRAYRELLSIQSRINTKQQTIQRLDTSHNQREIMELSNQISLLSNRYQQLNAQFSVGFSPAQIDNLNRRFQVTSENINLINRKVADVRANLARGIQLKLNNGTFQTDIINLETKFNNLSNKSNNLRVGIDQVRFALRQMTAAANSGNIQALINAEEAYRQRLKEVENQLLINAAAEKQAHDNTALTQAKQKLSLEMSNWLKNNSAAASQFGGKIKELQAQISACDKTTLGHLRSEFNNIKIQADMAGKSTQTLGDRIKTQFAKYSSYFSVASMFMYTIQGLRSMFNQVKAIDSAMTELKKVTDETDASYNDFLSNAASRAKEIGTTIDGLVSSTADFARLGYNFKDAQGLAEIANIYAVVGDEVEGVEGATESLISTMAAFKDEASNLSNTDFATSIIDKFNEIGNKFAISSGGIGEAMKRSASSLDAANNSIDESIALITAANTVVQNPDKVGNAFKTISMRMKNTTVLNKLGEPRNLGCMIYD